MLLHLKHILVVVCIAIFLGSCAPDGNDKPADIYTLPMLEYSNGVKVFLRVRRVADGEGVITVAVPVGDQAWEYQERSITVDWSQPTACYVPDCNCIN